jgi:FKBP-type peptidyl-prolyl cis-trans isomerase FkpA
MILVPRGISMSPFRAAVLLTTLAIILPAIPGCGDSAEPDRKAPHTSPAGTTASSSAKEIPSTSTTPAEPADAAKSRPDLPDLPQRAGAVDPDAPEEFTETDSGLRYRILRKSDGRKPQVNDGLVVDYKGWLDGGKEFDSSYKEGKPLPFILKTGPGGVIAGWVEGLQLVGVGGMIELEIPGALGYGPRGYPGLIPPDATLHFVVELKQIR